jgi:hypothetical protein
MAPRSEPRPMEPKKIPKNLTNVLKKALTSNVSAFPGHCTKSQVFFDHKVKLCKCVRSRNFISERSL